MCFYLGVLLAVVSSVPTSSADDSGSAGAKPKWVDIEELLNNSRVIKELKLTAQQSFQAKRAIMEPLAAHTRAVNKLQGLKLEEFQARLQQLTEEFNGRQREAVGKGLTAEQFKRIKQIQVRAAGLDAFVQPVIQQELKLDAEQKEKVKVQMKAFHAARADLQRAANGPEAAKKLTALGDETMEKLVGLLAEKQRKTWEELVGATFDFDPGK